MLEMMLSGGGDPNLVSWSGPGAKKLIAGNKEAGYFGTVVHYLRTLLTVAPILLQRPLQRHGML